MSEETTAPEVSAADTIRQAYEEYVLEHGKRPPSIFKFAKSLDMTEGEFYTHYTSFEHLEQGLWLSWFEETKQAIEAEEVWKEYSVREKLLAFYYTWMEVLKNHRSFILATAGTLRPQWTPTYLNKFRHAYKEFAKELLGQALQNEEVVQRPLISDRYDEALWGQALFLLGFWVKDDSPGFERTDAAIEKSVNLGFDLMGKGAVDSMLDFAKFLFQSR